MASAIILMPAQFTVSVGATQVECQLSEATAAWDVTSSTIKTLCEEIEVGSGEKGKLTLAGYQDWTDPDGICNFLWSNTLMQGDFVIVGTDQAGGTATLTGVLQCRRPSFGPTADDAAKFSLDLPIIGEPDLAVVAGP
jgi:hypothetical protein